MINYDELSSSLNLFLSISSKESKEIKSVVSVPFVDSQKTPIIDLSRHLPKDPSSINYGALASNISGHGTSKYYLTTAIAYTNGYPHIGHAYEFLSADVLVRYRRVMGDETYFLTGSDEHGQKVAASAEANGLQPLEQCNIYVNAFQALNQRLAVSCSHYLRTTDPYHEAVAQKLWTMCANAGDIYLDAYEGWYNEREEVFITDKEAEASNFLDIGSGLPLKRVREESYFFRMSKYCDRLIEFIESTPTFLQPEQYRTGILSRLRADGLRDLSISRTSFSWGIPVPPGFDQKHVMYVWFDALSNYLTGVHALEPDHPLSGFWPANTHIIGKDIVWFHAVIWPTILMSANLPLPGTIFTHGFINAADGRKMSKSYNNTIDPHEMLDRYPLDSIRYYLTASTTYGTDVNFSEPSLITMHNAELADTLGNLVHRGLNLCQKYCGGVVPGVLHDPAFALPFNVAALIRDISADANICALNSAIFKAMDAVRSTNKFLTEAEPWKMKGENESRRVQVVRTTLEALYVLAHVLAPVMPITAQSMFDKLGTLPVPLFNLKPDMYNLKPGTFVTVGEILFQKIDPEVAIGGNSSASVDAQSVGTEAEKSKVIAESSKAKDKSEKKGEEKKKKGSLKQQAKPDSAGAPVSGINGGEEDSNQIDFSKIDLRVGQIRKVWLHESADRLFCEEIDVGEEKPRQIASGLREHYTLEEMQNRKLVVVCNLKEAKLAGFVSSGMVLAAKSPSGKVELVTPPEEAVVGERVLVEGIPDDDSNRPWSSSRVKKYKVWETVAKDLQTNQYFGACWQQKPLLTSAGPCTVVSVSDSPIS